MANRDPMRAEVGDLVEYVFGMPGPDYEILTVTEVNSDGSFSAFSPMLKKCVDGLRLSDRNGPVRCGYVAKITRPGVNGF